MQKQSLLEPSEVITSEAKEEMIITIGGPIGSGKTTVAKAIAGEFGLAHISAGAVFRQMAKERNLTIEEFSKLAEKDSSIDKIIDEKQQELAKKGSAVIDGRLSAAMIKPDLKIWLAAPLEIRAKRVAEREGKDFETALKETKKRERSETRRYKKIYGIDLSDTSKYDLVMNTSLWSAKEVVEIISLAIRSLSR